MYAVALRVSLITLDLDATFERKSTPTDNPLLFMYFLRGGGNNYVDWG